MDVVLSAVIGDLTSRLISFIIEKSQNHVTSNDYALSRLQLLLLRAKTVVEEADSRRVTNRGMLMQRKQLREAMYRGYYVLDGSDIWWASRPKKRAILMRQGKLRREMDNLEAMLDVPERCMFGRHAEREQITNFLLHPSPCLEVLPVIGTCYVGKSTLVEHVCMDEVVKRNFSHILRLSSEDVSKVANNDSDNDKRRTLGLSDHDRYLMIAEFVQETDVVAWGKIYHSLRHNSDGCKVIIISRMDQVSSLGTVQAVRLTRLHQEEHWYFFRVLAFGSANPYDYHPDLASIGFEIGTEIDGSFALTNMITTQLRANMNMQYWRRVLWCVRKSMQTHILVFGEDPRHTQSKKRYLSYFQTFSYGGPLIFLSDDRYKIGSMALAQGNTTGIKTAQEVLPRATNMKYGDEFQIISQARIPPYTTHIIKCKVVKPKGVYLQDNSKRLKRKRNR